MALGTILRRDLPATVLVHDFPAGHSERMWREGMGRVGFALVYEGLRGRLVSTLAVFRRDRTTQ